MNFMEKLSESLLVNIAELVSNFEIIIIILLFIILGAYFMFNFKKQTRYLCESQLNILKNNKKYIEGVFVELNDTRELLRYFTNEEKWKNKIVIDYNNLFDDKNGEDLTSICKNYNFHFKLDRLATIDEIYNKVQNSIEIFYKLKEKKLNIPDEYKETAIIFQIFSAGYIEKLENLKVRINFFRNQYIILTGSAGNGKTNLLCNLTEGMIRNNKVCIFFEAKDTGEDINDFFRRNLIKHNVKYFNIYFKIMHVIYVFLRKNIYIVIDAINENQSDSFYKSLIVFLNGMLKYKNVKIIVSCRSEYFDLKYKSILIDKINNYGYCYDILKENYTDLAKEKIYENYKKAFNYSGDISLQVKEKLFCQLLLMRMFFEVNKNSSVYINSLNKYEIFDKYIRSTIKNNECRNFIDKVVSEMYFSNKYSSVMLSNIKKGIGVTKAVDQLIDESILLSRKLTFNENSIIQEYEEEIYFIFDEMRDYCVARYALMNLCDNNRKPVKEKVISYIRMLIKENAVCTEGVINYIYYFYKNSKDNDLCKFILKEFIMLHDMSLNEYSQNRDRGFNSWGLKLILDGNGDMEEYEMEYLKFIILKNPGNELSKLFAFLIEQEKNNGRYNLDLFLKVLFDIHKYEIFCNVLSGTISNWSDNGIDIDDFIHIDKCLDGKSGRDRFRCYLYVYQKYLNFNGRKYIEDYFESNCDKESIKLKLENLVYFESRN